MRAFAKTKDVNINLVTGTGASGRVTREDILTFLKQGSSPVAATQQVLATGVSNVSGLNGIPQQPPLTGITADDQIKKITGMKKAMTKTMTQSLSIPTFTYSDDIDATDLMKLRKELK